MDSAPKPYKHIEGWSRSVEWACDASRGVIMRGLFRIEGLSSQITGELAPIAGSRTPVGARYRTGRRVIWADSSPRSPKLSRTVGRHPALVWRSRLAGQFAGSVARTLAFLTAITIGATVMTDVGSTDWKCR
jgi:hypothetical protein